MSLHSPLAGCTIQASGTGVSLRKALFRRSWLRKESISARWSPWFLSRVCNQPSQDNACCCHHIYELWNDSPISCQLISSRSTSTHIMKTNNICSTLNKLIESTHSLFFGYTNWPPVVCSSNSTHSCLSKVSMLSSILSGEEQHVVFPSLHHDDDEENVDN